MKVLVYGYGLMGKKVAHAVMNDADLELAGVVSPVFDVQPEVPAYKSLDEVQDDIDAIIDFSHPANLDSILSYALKNKCKVVFATTGFSAEDLKKIEEASHEIALFQSYNTSYGVAMMNKMVSEFAKEFFEHHFDIEIMEKHHNQKIDSPSGTAVMLYDGINNALVEIYVTVELKTDMISPVSEKTNKIDYDVLIASTVINGRVPEFYGGLIQSKSNNFSIPIE